MRKKGKYILFIAILLLAFGCALDQQKAKHEKEDVYWCNAEEINVEKWRFTEANQKDFFFGNVEGQSTDDAVSGKHSVKLFPGAPFGMTCELKNVSPDDYLEITAWRKSKNHQGVIAIDGGPGYYFASKLVVEKGANHWEKLFLEYHVPPNFPGGKIKMYVWNNSSDTIYFDDLQIIHRNRKKYPDYSDVKGLQLHAEQADLDRLGRKRLKAFETTVLQNSDEDYAGAVLFDGNDFLNANFRLKGDLVDHLQGEKWSYRIKLKKGFAWKNMRTFSIQNPSTRYFLHEWLAHKIFEREDVLTTRYGFIPVSVNKKELGIYAWEEHFEKQLVESNNRREGPIIRFDEGIFWQSVLETKVTGRPWNIDFFGATRINPFKAGRTVGDSLLLKQFEEAQKLLLQYKNREKPVSEIFNVDNLARYYALIDITQAYHGFTWHNQRFYYNPVTCLLEPIAFDGYIETGIYKRIDEQVTGLLNPEKLETFKREELMLFQVFADSVFNKKYLAYLQQYASADFIEKVISANKMEADSLSELINREFPYYNFDFNMLKKQTDFIRKNMDWIAANINLIGKKIGVIQNQKFQKEYTSDLNKNLLPMQVNAYFNKEKEQIVIENYANVELTVLGTFMADRMPESFEDKPVLKPYKGVTAPQISLNIKGQPLKVLFAANNEMFETEVSQWPAPNGITARQKTRLNANYSILPISEGKIVFDGKYEFSADVVIPENKEVIFKPGTSIDFINGAGFYSFSSIKMGGTKNRPILITSSDKSANGFNIIQAAEKSVLQNVHFSGLSSLRKQGWMTPAAVTFYESDVDFDACTFGHNYNCDDALNVVRSEFLATNCTFVNTFADAFDSDFCTGKVQHCEFQNIGNDAIDFSGSQVEIADCKMMEITDKAISGGENSQLIVSNCEIIKANIGVAAKDLSSLTLDKIRMENTVYGLIAFVKKPEYGPASITIDNLKMKSNVIFHQIEEGSVLTLNGKTIYGNEKNLAVKLYQ